MVSGVNVVTCLVVLICTILNVREVKDATIFFQVERGVKSLAYLPIILAVFALFAPVTLCPILMVIAFGSVAGVKKVIARFLEKKVNELKKLVEGGERE